MTIVCFNCNSTFSEINCIINQSAEKIYCPNCNVLIAISCTVCAEFIAKNWINEHMINIHDYKRCNVCKKTFPNEIIFYHMKNIHNYTQCHLCKNYFNTKDNVIRHLQKIHKLYLCKDCNKYVSLDKRSDHEQNYCKSGSNKKLMTEFKNVDSINGDNNSCIKKRCPICLEVFTENYLDKHIKKDHKHILCKYCNFYYPINGYKKHLLEEHRESYDAFYLKYPGSFGTKKRK